MTKRLELTTVGEVTVVRLKDHRLVDERIISELGEELNQLASSQEHSRLLLDFEEVSFFSTGVLGVLISAKKKASLSQTALKLCNINPEIFEVFQLTRLDRVFDIYATRKQALAAFAAAPS